MTSRAGRDPRPEAANALRGARPGFCQWYASFCHWCVLWREVPPWLGFRIRFYRRCGNSTQLVKASRTPGRFSGRDTKRSVADRACGFPTWVPSGLRFSRPFKRRRDNSRNVAKPCRNRKNCPRCLRAGREAAPSRKLSPNCWGFMRNRLPRGCRAL